MSALPLFQSSNPINQPIDDPTGPPTSHVHKYTHIQINSATATPPAPAPAPAPAVRTALDVYLMAKLVATLYLVYPACRGARVLYQKWVDPEERAKRAVRDWDWGCGCGRVCKRVCG